jgi:predicted  nucleic acid-binding Zn-ribbon protein
MAALGKQTSLGLRNVLSIEYDYTSLQSKLTDAFRLRERLKAEEARVMERREALASEQRDCLDALATPQGNIDAVKEELARAQAELAGLEKRSEEYAALTAGGKKPPKGTPPGPTEAELTAAKDAVKGHEECIAQLEREMEPLRAPLRAIERRLAEADTALSEARDAAARQKPADRDLLALLDAAFRFDMPRVARALGLADPRVFDTDLP